MEQSELLKELLGNAIGDANETSDLQIKMFDRLCIGFLTNYVLSTLPEGQINEVKTALYDQWLVNVNATKANANVSEGIFSEFFGVKTDENLFDNAFKISEEYVKSVLNLSEGVQK